MARSGHQSSESMQQLLPELPAYLSVLRLHQKPNSQRLSSHQKSLLQCPSGNLFAFPNWLLCRALTAELRGTSSHNCVPKAVHRKKTRMHNNEIATEGDPFVSANK